MEDSNNRKVSKTTIKVTTSAPSTLIRPNTKLKIQGSFSFDNTSDEETNPPPFTIEKLQELRDNGEETPPFDSGFFGHPNGPSKDKSSEDNVQEAEGQNRKNASPTIVNTGVETNTSETDKVVKNDTSEDSISVQSDNSTEEPLQVGMAVRRCSVDSEPEKIAEVQHARFRCQPIYNIEKVQTPTLQKSVVQNSRDDSFLNRRCQSVNDRRYASMRATSSRSFENQRSSTSKISNRAKSASDESFKPAFEKPKSAKLQAFLSMRQNNLDEGVSRFTQEENLVFRTNVGKSNVRQYPIERTYVGSASPKFHRRATMGNASAPTSGRITPTLYDPKNERKKLTDFSKALSNAVWRKKQFSS